MTDVERLKVLAPGDGAAAAELLTHYKRSSDSAGCAALLKSIVPRQNPETQRIEMDEALGAVARSAARLLLDLGVKPTAWCVSEGGYIKAITQRGGDWYKFSTFEENLSYFALDIYTFHHVNKNQRYLDISGVFVPLLWDERRARLWLLDCLTRDFHGFDDIRDAFDGRVRQDSYARRVLRCNAHKILSWRLENFNQLDVVPPVRPNRWEYALAQVMFNINLAIRAKTDDEEANANAMIRAIWPDINFAPTPDRRYETALNMLESIWRGASVDSVLPTLIGLHSSAVQDLLTLYQLPGDLAAKIPTRRAVEEALAQFYGDLMLPRLLGEIDND